MPVALPIVSGSKFIPFAPCANRTSSGWSQSGTVGSFTLSGALRRIVRAAEPISSSKGTIGSYPTGVSVKLRFSSFGPPRRSTLAPVSASTLDRVVPS